jgi:hypothetical protein
LYVVEAVEVRLDRVTVMGTSSPPPGGEKHAIDVDERQVVKRQSVRPIFIVGEESTGPKFAPSISILLRPKGDPDVVEK